MPLQKFEDEVAVGVDSGEIKSSFDLFCGFVSAELFCGVKRRRNEVY